MKTGICGTGRMGAAMAERLLDQGHSVAVWNRTAERARPLVDRGAALVSSPKVLMESCDLVIVMVFDEQAQQVVYGGPDGLLSAVQKNQLIIDMCTMLPDAAKALGRQVEAAGVAFLECPVGGTVAPAKAGKLLGMAGGSDVAFGRAKPLLEVLCRRVDHVGEVGKGAAMKLAVNLPLANYWESLGEALSLAAAGGVDMALAGSLLADSSGAIGVAGARIQMIVDAVAHKPEQPGTFDVAGMTKDLNLMRQWAAQTGCQIPLADAAFTAYSAAVDDGWADNDAAVMAAWRCRENG